MSSRQALVPGAEILVRLNESDWVPATITKITIVRTIDAEYLESFAACVMTSRRLDLALNMSCVHKQIMENG